MDQVTISRELLRQALEVINNRPCDAVYEQQCNTCNVESALRTLLDAPAVEQEPVAWRWAYKGEPDSDKCFPMPVPDQDVQDVAKMRAFPRTVQLLYAAPQAQQPRIGTVTSVEQTLEQWEHDFKNPMTPEQQTDWVNREREFAAAQAQQHRKAVKLTDEEIEELVAANAGYGNNFNRVARAIEQAVWEKLGVIT